MVVSVFPHRSMENVDKILEEITDFENNGGSELTPALNDFLSSVAKTGETLVPWDKLKPVLIRKLEIVMKEFNEDSPGDDVLRMPNVDILPFDVMRMKLLDTISGFNSAPFTIQRLCELVSYPRKHYKRTDKFMRGVEKNVLVVSTVDPYGQKQSRPETPLVNGVIGCSSKLDMPAHAHEHFTNGVHSSAENMAPNSSSSGKYSWLPPPEENNLPLWGTAAVAWAKAEDTAEGMAWAHSQEAHPGSPAKSPPIRSPQHSSSVVSPSKSSSHSPPLPKSTTSSVSPPLAKTTVSPTTHVTTAAPMSVNTNNSLVTHSVMEWPVKDSNITGAALSDHHIHASKPPDTNVVLTKTAEVDDGSIKIAASIDSTTVDDDSTSNVDRTVYIESKQDEMDVSVNNQGPGLALTSSAAELPEPLPSPGKEDTLSDITPGHPATTPVLEDTLDTSTDRSGSMSHDQAEMVPSVNVGKSVATIPVIDSEIVTDRQESTGFDVALDESDLSSTAEELSVRLQPGNKDDAMESPCKKIKLEYDESAETMLCSPSVTTKSDVDSLGLSCSASLTSCNDPVGPSEPDTGSEVKPIITSSSEESAACETTQATTCSDNTFVISTTTIVDSTSAVPTVTTESCSASLPACSNLTKEEKMVTDEEEQPISLDVANSETDTDTLSNTAATIGSKQMAISETAESSTGE